MPRYEIWIDRGRPSQPQKRPGFTTWHLFRPLPRTSAEVTDALARIIEEDRFLLITISKAREPQPPAKPRPD